MKCKTQRCSESSRDKKKKIIKRDIFSILRILQIIFGEEVFKGRYCNWNIQVHFAFGKEIEKKSNSSKFRFLRNSYDWLYLKKKE